MTVKKPRIVPIIIITALVIYALFFYKSPQAGCTFYSMGGIETQVKIFNASQSVAKEACSRIQTRYEELEHLFSTYRKGSFISRLNEEAFKKPVQVPDDLFIVLRHSVEISKMTNGYFSVAIKPLLDLWQNAQKENRIPDKSVIASTRILSASKWIQIDSKNKTVRFLKEGVKIDLGAIAKGYMADEAITILRSFGIQRGLVNSGGDIVMFDVSPEPVPFKIAVYNPNTDKNDHMIELTNGSVVTSGNYNRYYTINNQRFSHILNPHTGYPDKGCKSVTVISSKGYLADAIATAVCADPDYPKDHDSFLFPENTEILLYTR